MAKLRHSTAYAAKARKLSDAMDILKGLGFSGRQSNRAACYTLLAMLDLRPSQPWSSATGPCRGITPIIAFIAAKYKIFYAPNTRETIRDEAVKFFVEFGILIRNPDDPHRPVNSGKTVYQVESNVLALFRTYGGPAWPLNLTRYLDSRSRILKTLKRERKLKRIPVTLPSRGAVTISPGGPCEVFCRRFHGKRKSGSQKIRTT